MNAFGKLAWKADDGSTIEEGWTGRLMLGSWTGRLKAGLEGWTGRLTGRLRCYQDAPPASFCIRRNSASAVSLQPEQDGQHPPSTRCRLTLHSGERSGFCWPAWLQPARFQHPWPLCGALMGTHRTLYRMWLRIMTVPNGATPVEKTFLTITHSNLKLVRPICLELGSTDR